MTIEVHVWGYTAVSVTRNGRPYNKFKEIQKAGKNLVVIEEPGGGEKV